MLVGTVAVKRVAVATATSAVVVVVLLVFLVFFSEFKLISMDIGVENFLWDDKEFGTFI